MATKIERWRADDGTEFDSEKAAIAHEQEGGLTARLAGANTLSWGTSPTPQQVARWLLKRYTLVPTGE